jgi:hypothetical protein
VTTESFNETIQDPGTEKPASYFSILGNIFFSPGKAFQEVNRSSLLLWPIIGLIVVGLLGGYFTARVIDTQSMMSAQMEEAVAQGQMTAEQAQQAAAISGFASRLSFIAAPIVLLLPALIFAGFGKLIGVFVGAENRFKSLFTVTLLALTPYCIVTYALFILVASIKDTSGISVTEIDSLVGSNLGALLGAVLGNEALPKFLMNLCRRIDIFIIWEIALLAIGYAAVSKKLKTKTVAIWLSSVYLVFAILIAAGQSMMGR